MKVIKIKNTRNKTESVQVIAIELYDASDLRDWAYEHAWSGARDRLEDLDKYAGGWEILFDLIEQDAWQNASGTVTDTYINDTIWFVDEILDDFNSVYEDTLEESKTLRENTNEEMKIRTFLVNALEELQTQDVEATSLKLSGGYSLFVMGDDTVGNPEDKVLLVEIIYRGEYVDHDLVMTKDDIDLILELLDTARVNQSLHENKTLKENKTELNEDYVLRIEEDYDTNTLELFLLEDEAVLAHGSKSRNTIYPWYEALVNFLSSLDTLTLDRDGVLDHEYPLTELEDEVEALGYKITETAGYSQGDHYAVVTEHEYDSDFLTDIVYNTNFYNAKILKIGRGRLIYQDSVNLFNIDAYDADMVYEVGEMLSHFSEKPAYYQIDSRIYYKDKFAEACEELGLKNFDTLEESKKSKGKTNLTEGAFDELSFNYKEDLAALYSVASFMDYEEYNEEFGTKYRSKRAYERGLYQDLLHIIDGAKASGDLSETDVYNVDDILNANAEFIDILAGIITYFNI